MQLHQKTFNRQVSNYFTTLTRIKGMHKATHKIDENKQCAARRTAGGALSTVFCIQSIYNTFTARLVPRCTKVHSEALSSSLALFTQPKHYGIRRFITAFTNIRNHTLTQVNSILIPTLCTSKNNFVFIFQYMLSTPK
jgi:hypothetical protein